MVEKQLELDWNIAATLASDFPDAAAPIQVAESIAVPPSEPSRSPSPGIELTAYGEVTTINSDERIQYLEQALDQCQIYINELKAQLVEQEFLENQLAITEDVSNIQQQAIITLKAQLLDQQELTTQITTAQEQQQTLTSELRDKAALVQTQQMELEQLRTQIKQEQQTIAYWQQELSDRQRLVSDLETRLQEAKQTIGSQQEIISTWQQSQGSDANKNKVIQSLSKTLLAAQNRLEAMEAESSNHLILQMRLQHSLQELETQKHQDQERINHLEHQVAEMQEQILHQAQQGREYETAVQHWKDRCLTAEQSVAQLKTVLEQILLEHNLVEWPSSTNVNTETEESSPKGLKIDLPTFLQRYRPI